MAPATGGPCAVSGVVADMGFAQCDGAKVRGATVRSEGAMVSRRTFGPSHRTLGPPDWTFAPSPRRPLAPFLVHYW